MGRPNIGVVISTTRVGRFGDRVAGWLLSLASQRNDAVYGLVDLRDYPLPFYDEPVSPSRQRPQHPVARQLSDRMAAFDGFIFVTAEYNHGIPAVLKNALDHLYVEMNRKPASFVGYGSASGARGIEQLRLNLIQLEMAPLQAWVGLGIHELRPLRAHEKDFGDFPHLAAGASAMLDELMWWTQTLKNGRENQP